MVHDLVRILIDMDDHDKIRINLDKRTLGVLHAERERTGLSSIAILKEMHSPPSNLTCDMINQWFSGQKTANKAHLDLVIATYRKQPDKKPTGYQPKRKPEEWTIITDELRSKLRAEQERTGVSPANLQNQTPNWPHHLTAQHIDSWRAQQKSTQTAHIEFVVEAYAALPTLEFAEPLAKASEKRTPRARRLERRVPQKVKLSPRAVITDAQRRAMSNELKRAGVRYATVMNLIPPEFASISVQMIKGWISGKIKKARPEHIECILNMLKSFPDKNATFSKAALTASRKARLAPPKKLPQKTRKISDPMIPKKERVLKTNDERVIWPRAHEVTARRIHPDLTQADWPYQKSWTPMRYMPPRCRAYPNLYEPIDEHLYNRLHAEVRRTCVSPSLLLYIFKSAPSGLPQQRISAWLRLVTRSAETQYLEWVLKAYALLPDSKSPNKL